MIALLICGDRNWLDFDTVWCDVNDIRPDIVIVGGARGADDVGRRVAADLQIDHEVYPAKWKQYGRSAGPIRNKVMLSRLEQLRQLPGYTVRALAYHDKIEESKGTANMVALLEEAGIETEVRTHG
jgi:hypothetical protein